MTGGTGKTPVVIALAGACRDLGYHPVVLSRGYRRTSNNTLVASKGEGPIVSWEKAGDEPFMISMRLPNVAVVVGSSRYEAGCLAEKERLGDLFILDDGFQHRQLARDVDIVTIDLADWHKEVKLLPTGQWREPKSALARADFICVGQESKIPDFNLPTFSVETVVDGIFRNGSKVPVESLRGVGVTAFAGIAKPERFFATLEKLGLELIQKKIFPDHHTYKPRELSNLGDGIKITTEKDIVRLPPGDFHFLRISANILRLNELRELIVEKIGSKLS